MSADLVELFHNRILAASVLSWILAQITKFVICTIREKQFDLTQLTKSGGMPSGHAALVSSVTTGVGDLYGFSSGLFALSAVLSIIVMYDAAGVRQSVGIQARIINDLVHDLYRGNPVGTVKIKEILGHTPVEVIAGAMLGIAVAMLL